MPDDSLPWWLGGTDESSADPPASMPYPRRDERMPPPPPPPRQDDSAWLRDDDPFAPPLRAAHEPPTVSPRAFVDASDAPPRHDDDEWNAPLPPAPTRRRNGPMSPIAPPTPPRRPTPAATSRSGNGSVRALAVIFVILLVVTGGVAIARSVGGNGFSLPGLANIIPPTATPTGYARSAKISFTRTTQNIAAPSSTLIAATDGSGQVKATIQTASVTGATSAAIPASYQEASNVIFTLTVANNSSHAVLSGGALSITSTDSKVTCGLEGSVSVPANGTAQQKCDEPIQKEPAATWNYTDPATKLNYSGNSPAGGNAAYYFVPTNCGDSSPAVAAAQAAMQGQLSVPAGDVVLFGPKYGTDPASLSCSPIGGTQQPASFTYTQKINGTGSQTVVAVSDVQQYQAAQVKTKIPANFALITSQICPDGPRVGTDATATRATITCPATASVGWNWTPATLAQLAGGLASASVDTAKVQLNGTQGIMPGSVQVALTDGSEMPQDPTTITFAVSP